MLNSPRDIGFINDLREHDRISDVYFTDASEYVPYILFQEGTFYFTHPHEIRDGRVRKLYEHMPHIARMVSLKNSLETVVSSLKDNIIKFMNQRFATSYEELFRNSRTGSIRYGNLFSGFDKYNKFNLQWHRSTEGFFAATNWMLFFKESEESLGYEILACVAMKRKFLKLYKLRTVLNEPTIDLFEVIVSKKLSERRFKNIRKQFFLHLESHKIHDVLEFEELPIYPKIKTKFSNLEEYQRWGEELSQKVIRKLRNSRTYNFSR
jgi:hypothetical protein